MISRSRMGPSQRNTHRSQTSGKSLLGLLRVGAELLLPCRRGSRNCQRFTTSTQVGRVAHAQCRATVPSRGPCMHLWGPWMCRTPTACHNECCSDWLVIVKNPFVVLGLNTRIIFPNPKSKLRLIIGGGGVGVGEQVSHTNICTFMWAAS